MKRLLLTVLALALALTGFGAPRAAAEPAPQWRSYWVDAFNPGIYDAGQVAKLVADAQAVNANALLVQTVRRFDCFCNDALYPRTGAAIAPAPFDPLAEIVKQGKAAGLEVHAWVNVTTLWNAAAAPTDPNHVYNTHGFTATGADRWLNKRHDGVERVGNNSFIDPANPAVVDYIVEGIRSIQANYDIDGINLDYIRYPDYNVTDGGTFVNDWGYSDVSLARFGAATGRTDVPAPTDEQFSDWRRDQVSALVRKIYVEMYATDAADRLSINGITYAYGPSHYGSWEQTRPYANVMQDWYGWSTEGIVDTVTAMNYKREWMADQEVMFDTWNSFIAQTQADSGRTMVSGPALYLNDLDNSVQQAREVTGYGLGWSGYSYANVSLDATASTSTAVKDAERDALAAKLVAGVFAEEVAVPEMTWKTNPVDGIIAGTLTANGSPVDQARITIDANGARKETRTVTTDGSGWFAAVKLPPGRYRVKVVDRTGLSMGTSVVVVRAGGITEVALRAKKRS